MAGKKGKKGKIRKRVTGSVSQHATPAPWGDVKRDRNGIAFLDERSDIGELFSQDAPVDSRELFSKDVRGDSRELFSQDAPVDSRELFSQDALGDSGELFSQDVHETRVHGDADYGDEAFELLLQESLKGKDMGAMMREKKDS
ncbi:MAG: hypothetical protein HQK66_14010, partial [Desulfamplus sp.]|nr:hypothetical protein [Desulfamplus sp.]